MFIDIDTSLKPLNPKLFICKPNRQIIGKLNSAYDIRLEASLKDCGVVSFSLPYKIDIRNELVDNPDIVKTKHRYLIKFVLGNYEQWFYINKPNEEYNEDSENKTIECFSLEHMLNKKPIRKYKVTSYSPTQVLTDVLQETGWNVGYINLELNNKKRAFDVPSKSKYEFIKEMAETFEGIVLFNTINKTVNLYKEDEIGQNKGLKIKHGRYLKSLNKEIETDNFCTRLEIKGKDGLSIYRVNPLGTSYLEDFSYFMYPYTETITDEIDDTYIVNSHSDYMSDGLCHAILKYNKLIDSKKNVFNTLLSEKETLQANLTIKENELSVLDNEMVVILNSLDVVIETDGDKTQLLIDRNNKDTEINNKKQEIAIISSNINNKDTEITNLQTLISKESNFSPEQLEELNDFVIEQEWSDDNYFNDVDLYIAGEQKLYEINKPKDSFNIDIVNFLSIVESQLEWDKLSLGDIVNTEYEMFNLDATFKILEMDFNFEENDINLTIGDIKNTKTEEDKFYDLIYKTKSATDSLNINKTFWESMTTNFNKRNDRVSVPPSPPIVANDGTAVDHTLNSDSSVNISFEWIYEGQGDSYNIDGFLVYVKSSTDSNPYMFGSTIAKEFIYDVDYSKKAFVLYGVPANNYYTFGVRAYRKVDNDINIEGVLRSEIIQSTFSSENPYKPESNVAFSGNVTGTVNNIPVGDIADKEYVDEVAIAKANLARIEAEAYADGIVSEEETRAIADAQSKFDSAVNYVDENITPSTSTVVVASYNSKNYKYANYIVPFGSYAQLYINNAINSLSNSKGKVILLEGNYKINDSIILPSNITLEGLGVNTIIDITDIPLYGTAIKNSDFELGNERITISNIAIKGADYLHNQIFGIHFYKSNGILVSNCFIDCIKYSPIGLYGDIYFNQTNNSVIQSCIIKNSITPIIVAGSDNVVNSVILDNNYHSLYMTESSKNNTINSSVFSNNLKGSIIYGSQNNIAGCTFSRNESLALTIFGNDTLISSNSFYENSWNVNTINSQLLIKGNYNTILNNTARKGSLTENCLYGIRNEGNYNMITNNDLYQSGITGGLYDIGTGTITTAGNRI